MDRVLIVAPSGPMRGLEAAALTRYGFDVRTAEDAETALQLCLGDPPDVVVVPAGLAGADGMMFTAALRASPATRRVPVLALATSLEEVARQSEDAPADTVLLRPVRVRTLVQELTLLTTRPGVAVAVAAAAGRTPRRDRSRRARD